jgi:hypothetical protein
LFDVIDDPLTNISKVLEIDQTKNFKTGRKGNGKGKPPE